MCFFDASNIVKFDEIYAAYKDNLAEKKITLSLIKYIHIYIYIYIYINAYTYTSMCVCVCVYVCV